MIMGTIGWLWGMLSWQLQIIIVVVAIFLMGRILGINFFSIIWKFLKGIFGLFSGHGRQIGAAVSSHKKLLLIVVLIAVLIGGGWWLWAKIGDSGGGVAKAPSKPQSQTLGRWDTFRQEQKIVEIRVDGKLEQAVINPPAVNVPAGQNIAIDIVSGEISRKPWVGKLQPISPVEVIKFTIPGKKDEFRLNKHFITELIADQDGVLKFALEGGFTDTGSSFHTGTMGKKGQLKDNRPLKVRVTFLKELTGKGGPPEKIQTMAKLPPLPGLPGVGGIIDDAIPTQLEVDAVGTSTKAKQKAAEQWWKDDTTGKQVQEGIKAIDSELKQRENKLLKEVKELPKTLPEKKKEWSDKLFNRAEKDIR